MRLSVVLWVLILATVGLAQAPPGVQKPLGKNQIIDLVKAGMDSEELAKTVQERGIDFDLSDDYLEALRKVGAQDVLIKALRDVKPKPMTREQVLQLVVGGVPSQRAAALVKQRRIDFVPDEEYLGTLRVAGADDTLIAAVRAAGEAATAQFVVVTSPNAEVYLDGELKGRANAQGELALKAKLGAHALRVSLKGKKDFGQKVTLAARRATKIEARLEDLGPLPGAVRENPRDGLKYVRIPPGTFMMGCSAGDNTCSEAEKRSHIVTLTKSFWIGQTEVTVGAYKRFSAATGRQMPDAPSFNSGWASDSMPIVRVPWDEARQYCGWAGGRLPTEAEWEYAARGGSTEACYGNLDKVAWYGQSWWHEEKVAQKRANGFGLFDVLGNVREWVNDWYDQNYYQNSPAQDPAGPASGGGRVIRGGSWSDSSMQVRLSSRNRIGPGGWDNGSGVRCGGEVFPP